jgi:hypothetical protein
MRRLALTAPRALAMAAVFAACASLRSGGGDAGEWRLVHPPAVADRSFPNGQRLLPRAPLADWRTQATYATREACERSRRRAVDGAADRARREHGDGARYDLELRRAVNARCVTDDPTPY